MSTEAGALQGSLERDHRFFHSNFEAGRLFANPADSSSSSTSGQSARTSAAIARPRRGLRQQPLVGGVGEDEAAGEAAKTSELSHLFRALKAPAAARAMPALAERAREEQWSHERFLEAVLSSEVGARESHGGEARIKAARFPARKTLEEFDFTFQRSVKRQVIEHLGQLDFLHGKENFIKVKPMTNSHH